MHKPQGSNYLKTRTKGNVSTVSNRALFINAQMLWRIDARKYTRNYLRNLNRTKYKRVLRDIARKRWVKSLNIDSRFNN